MPGRHIGLCLCVAVATGLAALAPSGRVRAEDLPAGSITVVVALGAGGSMDVITRLYGQKLAERFDRPFVVENRGAAAGNIAAETVARAQPDGRTLLVASSGVYAINGTFFKALPYDPVRDFVPIALYVKVPFILVTRAQSPIASMNDLVAAARQQPGKLTFASTGLGLAPHLAGELLKAKLSIDLTHVPYKGSMSQALSDVMAGHVDLMFADPSNAIPLIKDGRLKAFGTSSSARLPQLPDLPTIGELIGAPDFEAVSWHAIAAPARTPQAVVDKLHAGLADAFKDPAIIGKIQAMGLAPINPPLGGNAARAYIAAETEKWGALLKRLDLVGHE